jgi:predicted tellurium resistance membrane protein TerC
VEFFTFEWITDPKIWASLITLMALEIVLGIDNLVFISILAGRLPAHQQSKARKVGLAMALVTRLMLLATLAWIVTLTEPFIHIGEFGLSWRDVILIVGGLFLLYKATHEIHTEVEGDAEDKVPGKTATTFFAVVSQIAIIDIIFSLDSVITAVGMADQLWVMVVAVVAAVIVMLIAADPLANFIAAHPTVKMLALSFLLLIGVMLIAEGMHFHIPKGYVYFALGFSVMVEGLNNWAQRRRRRARAAARAG